MPSEMPDTKSQMLYDATSIRYLEQEIHRQKVESKLPGVGMGVYYFMGTEILLGRWEFWGHRWGLWLYNIMKVLNAMESYT